MALDENEKKKVSVFPNPATNQITIQSPQNTSAVEVYSVSGQLVLEKTTNSQKLNINIASLLEGVYVLKIFTSDGVTNRKFVKN